MKNIVVPFTNQQITLLEMLREEKKNSPELNEMVISMFRAYAQQALGRDYK